MDNNPIQNREEPATPVPVPSTTTDTPKRGGKIEFSKTTIIASLSYVGPLIIVPYLTERENPFVMFHIKQGLVVLILNLALWVAGWFLGFLWPLLQVINFGLFVLAIIGIVYALQKKEEELPLVGSFAHHIKI